MAIYSEYEKERLLRTPIPEVLAHYGKEYRAVRKNMYLSPLREETDPSFCINLQSNTWFDFGTGEGGGVIDLVCRLSGCARRDALDQLCIINGRYPDAITSTSVLAKSHNADESPIVIDYISQKFSNRQLISYAASRGISKEILDANCQQICYHLKQYPSRMITAIGFMNDKGGYSLRSSRYKISNSSYISTILGTSDKESVIVFEGFFDFLSYLSDNSLVKPNTSVCVLNGVGNVAHSLPYLVKFKNIQLYLDNDAAGIKTSATIIDHLGLVSKEDGIERNACNMSHTYHGYKDYNSMLCDRTEKISLSSNNTQYGTIEGHPGKTGKDQLG